MMVVATLTHPPELCPARKEFSTEFGHWLDGMETQAERLGLKIHGAYVCPPEHTLYFLLEANDVKEITTFFSGLMLTHHTATISPVMPVKETAEFLK